MPLPPKQEQKFSERQLRAMLENGLADAVQQILDINPSIQFKIEYKEGVPTLVDMVTGAAFWLKRFITEDPDTIEMKNAAMKASKMGYEVLIYGETGTGKELIAQSMIGNPIWKYFGSEKKKVGKALKCCPACEEAVNIGRETCNHCGYIFLKEDIIKELKHEAEADTKSDMSKAKSAERIYTIGYIDYSEHTSQKGGISMKVTYHSGRFSCNQFVPFGNPNYYSKKKSTRIYARA